MQIPLIQGQFNKNDAIALMSELIQTKIKFHESRIAHASAEEDVKYRESKIIFLQNQLSECRKQLLQIETEVTLHAHITVEAAHASQ